MWGPGCKPSGDKGAASVSQQCVPSVCPSGEDLSLCLTQPMSITELSQLCANNATNEGLDDSVPPLCQAELPPVHVPPQPAPSLPTPPDPFTLFLKRVQAGKSLLH